MENAMNVQNTQKLLMAFPLLYRSIALQNIEEAAGGYFQIDDGWFDLLFELSKKIERVAKFQNLHGDSWPDVKLVEAQYASLRFKLHKETSELHKMAYKFECKSTKKCEKCGDIGKTRDGLWLETLCDSCDKHH
jgi:hypothetical protein